MIDLYSPNIKLLFVVILILISFYFLYNEVYFINNQVINNTNYTNPHLSYKWDSMEEIYNTYNDEYGFHKWNAYAKHYDKHIEHLRLNAIQNSTKVNILEIGVQSGGSARAWKRYYGPLTNYIGIDINPNCTKVEAQDIHIEIGSQLDVDFLKNICHKYGPFDLIVDDGGHTTQMIIVSFEALWGCLRHDGVYVIEDTHSMSMWNQTNRTSEMLVNGKDLFGYFADLSRNMIVYFHEINGTMMLREKWMDPVSKYISEISIYDSLIFVHYCQYPKMLTQFKKGNIWIQGR
jgi:hypothetical protein